MTMAKSNRPNKIEYYNYSKCLSYQRFINIITGGNGIGKTYGAQKLCIKEFLKTGKTFVWVRRFRSEVKKAKDGFFNKVAKEFPDTKFEVNGTRFYINGNLAGIIVALSDSGVNKGVSLISNTKYIVFDEYIIDSTDKFRHYLDDEMRKIFVLCEALGRLDNFTVFLLSNNTSVVNPCYLFFGVDFKDEKIWTDTDIYAEQCETPESLVNAKEQTRLARLTAKYDKEYHDYNVNNAVLNDTVNFIKERSKNAVQMFNIATSDLGYLKVYKGRNELGAPCYFVSQIGEQTVTRLTYTFEPELISENVIFIDKETKGNFVAVVNAFKRNKLFFETQEIKQIMLDLLKPFMR